MRDAGNGIFAAFGSPQVYNVVHGCYIQQLVDKDLFESFLSEGLIITQPATNSATNASLYLSAQPTRLSFEDMLRYDYVKAQVPAGTTCEIGGVFGKRDPAPGFQKQCFCRSGPGVCFDVGWGATSGSTITTSSHTLTTTLSCASSAPTNSTSTGSQSLTGSSLTDSTSTGSSSLTGSPTTTTWSLSRPTSLTSTAGPCVETFPGSCGKIDQALERVMLKDAEATVGKVIDMAVRAGALAVAFATGLGNAAGWFAWFACTRYCRAKRCCENCSWCSVALCCALLAMSVAAVLVYLAVQDAMHIITLIDLKLVGKTMEGLGLGFVKRLPSLALDVASGELNQFWTIPVGNPTKWPFKIRTFDVTLLKCVHLKLSEPLRLEPESPGCISWKSTINRLSLVLVSVWQVASLPTRILDVAVDLSVAGLWGDRPFSAQISGNTFYYLEELGSWRKILSSGATDEELQKAFARGIHERTQAGKTLLDLNSLKFESPLVTQMTIVLVLLWLGLFFGCQLCGGCCCLLRNHGRRGLCCARTAEVAFEMRSLTDSGAIPHQTSDTIPPRLVSGLNSREQPARNDDALHCQPCSMHRRSSNMSTPAAPNDSDCQPITLGSVSVGYLAQS
eukprot:TRINITY_DN43185_c0_g1_i1.p1 TRINITY_DN43185_c0_g1~~TRINITY_DN43185_c0_g1_i1.p1  ORF type:complete len:672 (-),score=42.92 TRINITY_DN43185_c0_g1_i1:640-2496(-)